ncbi:hypothetical protein CONLIGDRAFT_66127 [Coniochaeta ligniaria NRRL 30616]|uniref:Uncharacterized protein n=1 Tax=Coniochaeta ligniaria NRRL 30616 TaxID=1408157 RepID=A0A1J7K5X0_9PEZI|nr:hypothetical protein CONLIGDRAFT_66127 [Coniochaeta ligniaria NRRL 30616]
MATNPVPMRKPTLALATPSTANFPKDVLRDIPSAISATTPLSALSMFREPLPSAGLPSAGLPCQTPMSARIKNEEKTPITPPLAYMDFLKSISLASPPLSGKMPLNRTSTSASTASDSTTSTADSSSSEQVDSAPSTATSEKTDVSCKCDDHEHAPKSAAPEKMKSPRAAAGRTAPMSPLAIGPQYPMSAPATNLNFPSLNVPTSPLSNCGGVDSPKSPWSARSIRSPFDWDAALKSRRFTEVPGAAAASTSGATTPKTANAAVTGSKREARSTVRHVREVVTRTVTYTPRMAPAPKGKRRKLDHETAVDA